VPPRSGKEPWRSGGGCGRLPAYGCAIGIVLLVAALFAGVSLLRKSVWMTMERGRQQVVQGLPFQLPPDERLRTTRNLEHFWAVLETSEDPYPLMGEFVKQVRGFFEDGRLTVEEIEELNLFLEGVIEEAGIPGMQLGFWISNFEFRNFDFGFLTQPCVPLKRSQFRGGVLGSRFPRGCQARRFAEAPSNIPVVFCESCARHLQSSAPKRDQLDQVDQTFHAPGNSKFEIRNSKSVPV